MRIAGGRLKGRIINVPGGKDIRPSTEKTRGAIFSVLGDDIIDAKVADLFCGSGALGIEALSRGAVRAMFMDSSKSAIGILSKNLNALDLKDESDIHMMDVFRIRPGKLGGFSIIFADPPYRKGLGSKLISLLCLKKNMARGILVLEHESDWIHDGETPVVLKRLDFGDSSVTFYRLPAVDQDDYTGQEEKV